MYWVERLEEKLVTKKLKTPLELAQEHWSWLQEILDKQREMERKLFIDAFVHGFKHGIQKKGKADE